MVQMYVLFLLAGVAAAVGLFLVHVHKIRTEHRQKDSAHDKLMMELEIHKAQLEANSQTAGKAPVATPVSPPANTSEHQPTEQVPAPTPDQALSHSPSFTPSPPPPPKILVDDGHIHE